jgi:hypothetical protein
VDGAMVRDWSDRADSLNRQPDFRKLLGEPAWARLPTSVRARFATDVHEGVVTHYFGEVNVKASVLGRCFAQLCRLIGTPVAPCIGTSVPMHVRVFDNGKGVAWERCYEFAGRAPITVQSTKQIDDDGNLVESLSAGLYMRLSVHEEQGRLHFVSSDYFFRLGRWRLHVPGWFPPGQTHVIHEDLGNGYFRFTMRTEHSWLGEMFLQDGVFH